MRAAEIASLRRRALEAATKARRAAALLKAARDESHGSRPVEFLVGYEAEHLLRALLDAAETTAGLLHVANPEYDTEPEFDELVQQILLVRDVVIARGNASKRKRLAEKLSNTTGRTKEEAALFAAKALELAS
jgi:hypothetical protein